MTLPKPNPNKLYKVVEIPEGATYTPKDTYMVDFEENIAIKEAEKCEHDQYTPHPVGITWTVGNNPYGILPGTLMMKMCDGPKPADIQNVRENQEIET